MTFTAHAEIPEQPFPSKPPVDDAAALKNPRAGGRTVSKIAAWPASAIETTSVQLPVPASVTAAISGTISDAAAGPAPRLPARVPLQRPPLAHPQTHRVRCPALLLSIAQQRQHHQEFLREHHSARLLKMRPTAPAGVKQARSPQPTRVPRIQDEPLPAARGHGTTALASTTDPLPCAATADWPIDGRV